METRPSALRTFGLLAVLLGLPPAAGAAVQGPCGGGRFAVHGAVLPPDPAGTGTVEVGDDDPPTVRVEGCDPVVGTRRVRAHDTVVRARFAACGETRFRLRLAILPTCDALVGTARVRREAVRRFVGTIAADDPSDAGQPPATPPAPGDGGVVAPPFVQTFPEAGPPYISAFSPRAARVGDVVSILGDHFDRDGDGVPYSGTPPFRVSFSSQRGRFAVEPGDVAFVSPTELRVTVPAGAASGVVQMVVRNPTGGGERVFATAGVPFTVLDAAGTPLPALPTVLVRNDSQYDVVSVLVDGQEPAVARGRVIAVHDALAVPLVAAGTIHVSGAIGISAADPLFTFDAFATVGTEVAVVPVAPISLLRVLTGGRPSRPWRADPGRTILFRADGTWKLTDGAVTQDGTVELVPWPNHAQRVAAELQPLGERISLRHDPQDPSLAGPFDALVFRDVVYHAE